MGRTRPFGSSASLILWIMATFCRLMLCSGARYQLPPPSFVPSTSSRERNATRRMSKGISESVITSMKSNTAKKILGLLKKRKKRDESRQAVIEGPRMVFDLLGNPSTKSFVQQVIVSTEDFKLQYESKLSPFDVNVQLVAPQILEQLADTVTPQGILGICDIPSFQSPLPRQYPFFLVLDGVSDPGNVGTLLRSSLAVGVAGIILLPGSCDVWNPKSIRSSMGASFQIPIKEVSSWHDCVQLLASWNVHNLFAATMVEENNDSDGSKPYFDVNWIIHPAALVIGSEGGGLRPEIRESLSEKDSNLNAVHIPMHPGIESLNAAVCGSVMMFEYCRQCQLATRGAEAHESDI